jgi:hypothetical protein
LAWGVITVQLLFYRRGNVEALQTTS